MGAADYGGKMLRSPIFPVSVVVRSSLALAALASLAACFAPSDARDTSDTSESAFGDAFFQTQIHCDFPAHVNGPVASVSGTFTYDRARYNGGGYPTTGHVRVELREQNGHGSLYKNLTLDTTVSGDGLTGDVFVTDAQGSPVYTMDLRFDRTPTSIVHTASGATYTTTCLGPEAIPQGADLAPDFAFGNIVSNGNGTVDVDVDVTNQGTKLVLAPNGVRVSIAGVVYDATLFQNDDGHASAPNTLLAGEHGYLRAHGVPAGTLAECGQYPVVLDVDHAVQFGQPDPFGNDARAIATPCIMHWNTPITKERFGVEPPPWLAGKSLSDIVNSKVSGRPDGMLCSGCHHTGSGHPYSPDLSVPMGPATVVDGQTWGSGWGAVFAQQSIKPQPLKDAFTKWRNDGELP
jgi:hypothetical protein